MEVSALPSNLRKNQEDEIIELGVLLHSTTKKAESDETTPTKPTEEAAGSTAAVEVPKVTEVDLESDAQKDSDGEDSDDQSCCTSGK